jgi:hypothetical protein
MRMLTVCMAVRLNHPPNADQVFITPPSKHRILINDFTSYSEALEAATKKLHAVYPVSPQPRVKGRHPPPPRSIFLYLPSRLSSFLMSHPFSYPCWMYMVRECLRMYARAALRTRSSAALRSSPRPATDGGPARFSRTASVSTVPQTAVSCKY